jgi:hypothetical protein
LNLLTRSSIPKIVQDAATEEDVLDAELARRAFAGKEKGKGKRKGKGEDRDTATGAMELEDPDQGSGGVEHAETRDVKEWTIRPKKNQKQKQEQKPGGLTVLGVKRKA